MTEFATLAEKYSSPEARRLLEQERFILGVTEELLATMERQSITKVEIAQRLGSSRAYVTQLLSGSRNMTLRTLADVAWSLGLRATVHLSLLEGLGYLPLDVGAPTLRRRIAVSAAAEDSTEAEARSQDTGEHRLLGDAANSDFALAA